LALLLQFSFGNPFLLKQQLAISAHLPLRKQN